MIFFLKIDWTYSLSLAWDVLIDQVKNTAEHKHFFVFRWNLEIESIKARRRIKNEKEAKVGRDNIAVF